jgi:hypothetical protein
VYDQPSNCLPQAAHLMTWLCPRTGVRVEVTTCWRRARSSVLPGMTRMPR